MATAQDLYKEGRQLQSEKKFDEALAKFQAARDADEKNVVSMHAMVQCLTELARHEEAIALARKVTELEPDDHFAYIALSRAFQRAGRIPEAEYAMMQGQQAQMRARPRG